MGARRSSTAGAADTAGLGGTVMLWLALAEVVLAAALVVLDVLLPTILLLAMAATSLRVRRQGLASLGLVRPTSWSRLAMTTLLVTALWACVQLGLLMPLVNRATGEQQDLSEFESVHGHLATLAVLLVLSWTLAAVGEELAYRGYVATRVADVAARIWGPSGTVAAAMLVSAALFGLAHTEQGLVGVILTFFDGLFLATLRWRFGTLWAAVLAHGWNNTIGLTAFYLVGPIHGWW